MPLTPKRYVGLRVRELRRARGLTQEELAARVGKAVETISNIERGHAFPGLVALTALASALHVPVSSFFEGLEGASQVPPKRIQAESRLQQLAARLSDVALEIAIEQIGVLAERDSRQPMGGGRREGTDRSGAEAA